MKHRDLKFQITDEHLKLAKIDGGGNNPIMLALAAALSLPLEELYVDNDLVLIQDEALNIAIETPPDLGDYYDRLQNGEEVLPAEFIIPLPFLV
jgi:hypothetical protein